VTAPGFGRLDFWTGGLAASAILLAVYGVLGETLVLGSFDRDAGLLRLPGEVRREIDESHLWMEEYVGGETSIDLGTSVDAPLQRARSELEAALTGDQTDPALPVPRVDDAAARSSLERLLVQVEGLESINREKKAAPKTSGPGSETDRRFDEAFRRTLVDTEVLAKRISEITLQDRTALLWGYRGAAAALVLLLGGLAVLFRRLRTRERGERERLEEGIRSRTAQLAASEARFRALIETAADGIITINEKGTVETFNRAAARIFGCAPEEVEGRSVRNLMPSPYRDRHDAGLAEYLRTGVAKVIGRTVEMEGQRKDGSRFPLELSISEVNLGYRRTFLGAVRDVTERRRAAEELQRARELAEDAVRAKSEFLANMSHEIRTPLNGVIGMAGLLADTTLDPVQMTYAGHIRNSADHLLGLLNDVLDFSKIEAGKLALEPIPFDLRNAVEEAAELVAPRAAEKGVELLVRYDSGAPRRFIGDPGRIRQVLVNFAGNAVKFTAAGHVLIDVRSLDVPGESTEMRISVQDTGIGIPQDRVAALFERFTQADSSTTRRFGGTGLGLAISKKLVDLMGGKIGVSSEEGSGSEFWFSVRLMIDTAPPPASAAPASPQILAGLSVLLVDDNALNRRILREQLEHAGLRPAEADGGTAALCALVEARAAGDPFVLAVLDFQMPGMNGETLAIAIRSDPANAATALLLLTSSAHPGDAKRMHAAGFGAYLVKPARPSLLLESLAALHSAGRDGGGGPLITRHSLAEAASLAASLAGEGAPGPSSGFSLRVLLVEDNSVNQMVAARTLEKMGCRVDIASNGREALEMVDRLPYDLVLMDCQMPEMDGYEATGRIRGRRDGREAIPVIAMTAHALQGDRERCLAAGMDDYVSKPVSEADIRLVLARWGGARSPRVAAGAAPAPGAAPAAAGVPFSMKDLVDFLGGDEGLARDIVETFRRESPAMLNDVREAARLGSCPALGDAAHRLRGALLTLTARPAAEAAQNLERLGRGGGPAEVAEALHRFEFEMELLERVSGQPFAGRAP
jgi:PAS domain S-box-containing protein